MKRIVLQCYMNGWHHSRVTSPHVSSNNYFHLENWYYLEMNISRTTIHSLTLLSPLIGIFFGVYVAYKNDISIITFASNIIAALLGIPLALLLNTKLKMTLNRHILCVSIAGFVLLMASIFSSNIEDIHRWILIGNINLNISMVITPLILYVISKSIKFGTFFTFLLTMSVLLIFILQPDAGQTTSFGISALFIFLLTRNISLIVRFVGFIIISGGIVIAWIQPDSLPPVEQVELIMQLAIKIGIVGIAGLLFTIVLLITPILFSLKFQCPQLNDDAILKKAFIIYFLTQLLVTFFGNYPVPIIGAGAAPIIGWYIILGCTPISCMKFTPSKV